MIEITLVDNKERIEPKRCILREEVVMASFLKWVKDFNPDFISSKVLHLLIEKYCDGNRDALFGKMKQLESDEHYELCLIFKNMFDSMKLNNEYWLWTRNYI